jgi:transcriptional regulator with GAF, ATPase, and Fis domain/tetratricopeptide (TPR) repeat protein
LAHPAASLSLVSATALGSAGAATSDLGRSSPPVQPSRAFVDFDARLVAGPGSIAGIAGVVVVRAPQDVHAALLAHAARRVRTSGWSPVVDGRVDRVSSVVVVPTGAPIFREIASQLGLPGASLISSEPHAFAEAIAQAASVAHAAIVAPLPREGTWDRAVASELVRIANGGRGLFVFVTGADLPSWEGVAVSAFDLSAELTASDKLRWLSAVAEEAQVDLPGQDIRTLEAWWAKARRVTGAEGASLVEGAHLGEAARAVLTCLALAGRSLSVVSIATLGDDAVAGVDELLAAALVTRSGNLFSISSACDVAAIDSHASDAERLATARLLAGGPGFDPDPWAYARSAELLVAAGAVDAADVAIEKAIRGIDDGQATYEITSRWFAAVASISGEAGLLLRVRGAHRALAMGEANDAQRWCESAAALSPEDPTIALLMGRALMQLGDLVAARVSLQKAEAAATDDELRARVSSELAELSYLAGNMKLAAEHATRAITLATTAGTRLGGRNTLGKINLVEARWDDADAHFAEDALTASAAGEATAELRARLNRGIALISKGLLDDARTTLERVLEDGARLGEDRARAYAFANLGVIAYRQRDYGAALASWDQAVRFRQTLRGRVATAHTLANLAELRLRLGLIDHAEHTVAFGRRLLVGASAPTRTAHYKRVAAQIALARKNTELARREIEAAQIDAEVSGDKDELSSVLFVAARVALEDGDVVRAASAVAQAQRLATGDRANAEAAILKAHELRARGALPGAALEAAADALARARACGEEDLLAEIHALLATLCRDAGDVQAAQAHCCRAIAVRDQVAAGLPADIRSAFLAKPDIVAVSRLNNALASVTTLSDNDVEEEAPRTQRLLPRPGVDAAAPAREIIGNDPEIRSLISAIGKVARANSTVLIRGESGTGKELVAEALHRASERANGPLVSVNCAALVETLLLSELFGHEKGAFTGAASRRRGRFEMAEGGTLFLDEIGDISSRTQVALLRVLQEKTFERVGGTQPIRANVRVICATHRDLKAMVERGEFREDLYYRLKGITLEVPPLRARLGDLPKIADHLLGRIALERNETAKTLGEGALDLLQRHRWAGNIRELENVLRAVSLFADGEVITASDLIDNVEDFRAVAQSGPPSGYPPAAAPLSLRASLLPPPVNASVPSVSGVIGSDGSSEEDDGSGMLPDTESGATSVAYATVRQGAVSLSDMKRQIERDCIARALAETKGNITRAAALLGMKRPRLSQLVKQYGLAASSESSQ